VLYALSPLVAIANVLLFYGLPKPKRVFARGASNVTRVNFKNIQRATESAQAEAPRHKCAVCGKTELSNPELDFRYCAQCDGYKCYCSEHINNHEHH
jgi:hypothetical protein